MISLELANAIYRDRQREIEKALRVRSIRDEIEPLPADAGRTAPGRLARLLPIVAAQRSARAR